MTIQQVNIGILGLGTVGAGTATILSRNAKEITRRTGKSIKVTHAVVRDLSIKRDCDINDIVLTDDVMAMVTNPSINLIVELIGGTTLAFTAIKQAILNKKHIVTANKALIAMHGNELLSLAKENNVSIAFEATVAGGIPIIKAIREGLTANKVEWIAGIINGTSNFILSEMQAKGRNFESILQEAQELGYAEADPSFDIEGIDAAHKLTILASISFGIPLQFAQVFTEGITGIETEDVNYANELGYNIKHLGIAKQKSSGIELRVHPTLIPQQQLLANVDGVMNAVLTMSDAVGATLYYGAGAGAEPTASAVIADIVDIVRTMDVDNHHKVPALAFQTDAMNDTRILSIEEVESSYYIRAQVSDKPGVLAKIATILAKYNISIETFIQKDCVASSQDATIVLLTHIITEKNIDNAIREIIALPEVKSQPIKIRMELLN